MFILDAPTHRAIKIGLREGGDGGTDAGRAAVLTSAFTDHSGDGMQQFFNAITATTSVAHTAGVAVVEEEGIASQAGRHPPLRRCPAGRS